MFWKLLREFFLLPRGEQRAMILVCLFLIVSLAIRIVAGALPEREHPGTEQFMQEARDIMATLELADSLRRAGGEDRTGSPGRRPASVVSQVHQGSPQQPASIDLNTVDSVGLLPLPGIGPVFAGRIVSYRELLGGFHSPGQLLEVYGMKKETLERIRTFLITDTTQIRRLPLNNASFSELLRHPYLEYSDVKALVKYRELLGPVLSLDELIHNKVISDSVVSRIGHYLDLQQE